MKMTKAELYTLRMNILGGMDEYIRNAIDDDAVTEYWNDRGIEEGIDEDILLDCARDTSEFRYICILFGNILQNSIIKY